MNTHNVNTEYQKDTMERVSVGLKPMPEVIVTVEQKKQLRESFDAVSRMCLSSAFAPTKGTMKAELEVARERARDYIDYVKKNGIPVNWENWYFTMIYRDSAAANIIMGELNNLSKLN